MKNLVDYINEAIEIEPGKLNDYRTIVLKKRTDLNLTSLDKKEFVKMMYDDYKEACKEAENLLNKEHEDSKEERVAKVRAAAEKYAAAKWKTEKRRQQYIDTAVANETSKERQYWGDVTSFDFDLSFGRENGGSVVIRDKYGESAKKTIERIYDTLSVEKNKRNDGSEYDNYGNSFWKDATGWAFKYTAHKNSYTSAFRPWVDLILSDTKKEEIKQNEYHLAKAINDFYSGTNYWGD